MGIFIDATWTATIASDADWRDRAQRVRNALIAAGATRVTGIVGALPDDLSAVLRPAANTSAGFDIWRFNDDKHNTGGKKCFLKLDMGTGLSNNTVFGMWAQVRTDIDANGNLPAGAYQSDQQRVAYSSAPNNAGFYASCENDRITFFAGLTAQSNSWSYHVERVLEADGAQSDFLVVMGYTFGGQDAGQILRYDGTPGPRPNASQWWIGTVVATASGHFTTNGTDRAVSPAFIPVGSWKFGRICSGRSADFANGTVYSFNYLGRTRSFLCIGHFNSTSNGILVPWEA